MIQSTLADKGQKRKITSDITNRSWYNPEKSMIVDGIDGTSADEAEKAISKTDLRIDVRRGTAFREVMGRGNYSWDERKRRLHSVIKSASCKIESVPSHHARIKIMSLQRYKVARYFPIFFFLCRLNFLWDTYTFVKSVKQPDTENERSSTLIY